MDGSSLPLEVDPSIQDRNSATFLAIIEEIRCAGAVRFGLATDIETAHLIRGTPEVAILSPPRRDEKDTDIEALSFTMGKPHYSLQLTGAVCIGAAIAIHGTAAWEMAGRGRAERRPKHGMSVAGSEIAPPLAIRIRHPAGVIHVETTLAMDCKGEVRVDNAAVFKEQLFDGNVFYRP
ncbi:hypothetical protein BJX99DRAFT_29488 [Aspergillus californicus]